MNDNTEIANTEAASRLQRLIGTPTILTTEEAADLRAVLWALRCYRFERDNAKAAIGRIETNWKRAEAGDKAKLQRVWGLVDHKRKTLLMADLYAALLGDHETTAAEETPR